MAARGATRGYLHGFTSKEQARLYEQARHLEPYVFERVDFSRARRVIEVGCGVGAEIEILLERFPRLAVRGVDASAAQIARARRRLAAEVRAGRVSLAVGDALALDEPDAAYDGAFVCWFLEHVARPVEILREVRRVVRPRGVVYCSEVQNASLFLDPPCPAAARYWTAVNAHQRALGGDPFVGAKLANHLLAAGFRHVEVAVRPLHFDDRDPDARARQLEYWTELMLSGAPGLLAARRVTRATVAAMQRELARIGAGPGSVFFYTWVQARARA